ncbi:hypothetical protein WS99_26055 [Burkholderia territorii]|nr:hypothetical protein WS99_26055 [Burkholderia territorii]KWA02832.1 hypothetical protein WT36_22015 [Burkholderia territorii]
MSRRVVMAVRADEEKEHGSAPPVALGYLQKAWEWQWALRLTYLLLFTDLALLVSGRHGLLHWSIRSEALQESAGFLCLAVTAFGLIASIGIPVLAEVARSVVVAVVCAIPWQLTALFRHEPDWKRPGGCVTPFELRNLALDEKDDFLLRLYDKYDRRQTELREQRRQAGNLVFGVLLLMVLDGMDVVGGSTQESIVDALVNVFHPWSSMFWWGITIAGFMALKWAWWDGYEREWIYYPPLHRSISAAEEEHRREMAKFRGGVYK